MTVVITLDMVLAQRKLSSKALALAIDITPQNLSLLKRGRSRACGWIRWTRCAGS